MPPAIVLGYMYEKRNTDNYETTSWQPGKETQKCEVTKYKYILPLKTFTLKISLFERQLHRHTHTHTHTEFWRGIRALKTLWHKLVLYQSMNKQRKNNFETIQALQLQESTHLLLQLHIPGAANQPPMNT